MNWAKTLRRWTMRSIHAAILGSALLGSASAVWAQPIGAAISSAPGIHYTRSQTFDLPVAMKQEDRQLLSEIRLYVKTPGAGWKLQERGTPDLTRFSCRIGQDGEYWYTLALVDRSGRMTPADVAVEPPSQRVIVDTAAPVLQVQPANCEGDFCLKVTAQDAHPDLASLKAVCKTELGDIPLEMVPNQPGMFRIKGAEMMRFPVVVSMRDMAGNVGAKEVNLREMVAGGLTPAQKMPIAQTGGAGGAPNFVPPPRTELPVPRTDVMPPRTELPAPRADVTPPPTDLPPLKDFSTPPNQVTKVEFPPPAQVQPPPAVTNTVPNPTLPTRVAPAVDTSLQQTVPHQLINTTVASVEYRIEQVGPSGVGKVEIYMTPDKGQTWHRLGENDGKRSPATVNLPGDGVYGIRIAVANGNGFGGRAPVRGDAPHCIIEVDTTAPFVLLRSTDVHAQSGHVEIRWNATDKNLGADSVAIFYRSRQDGPWQVIAKGLKNDGLHRWAFPREAGGQFFFKVEVTDRAGNVSHDVSRQPIVIDMTEPRATVIGVTSTASPRQP